MHIPAHANPAVEARLAENLAPLHKPPIDLDTKHPPPPDPTTVTGTGDQGNALRDLARSRIIDDCGTVPRHPPLKGKPPPPPPPWAATAPELPRSIAMWLSDRFFPIK